MGLDKDELAKLSPEERIQKLKGMEDQAKKELEEAERLITESKKMIDSSQQEMLDKAIKEEAAAIRNKDSIDQFLPHAEGLEGAAEDAPKPDEESVGLNDLYTKLKDMAGYQENGGYVSPGQLADVEQIVDHLGEDYKTVSEQYDLIQASRGLLDELKGDSYIAHDPDKDYHP
jgi:hypothetical protein